MSTPTYNFFVFKVNTERFLTVNEQEVTNDVANVSVQADFRLLKDRRQVGVYLQSVFVQGQTTIMLADISCHFEVLADDWGHLQRNGQTVLPQEFATHLCIITVGALRGVLHAKTENTCFNRFFLPLLDATQMVTADVVF